MTQEFEELSAKLEDLGESEVRVRLAHGSWAERSKRFVEEWLRSKKAQHESDAAAKRDAREEETLSIAREANSIARNALEISRSDRKIAIIAILLSTIMAIKEIIAWLSH